LLKNKWSCIKLIGEGGGFKNHILERTKIFMEIALLLNNCRSLNNFARGEDMPEEDNVIEEESVPWTI